MDGLFQEATLRRARLAEAESLGVDETSLGSGDQVRMHASTRAVDYSSFHASIILCVRARRFASRCTYIGLEQNVSELNQWRVELLA